MMWLQRHRPAVLAAAAWAALVVGAVGWGRRNPPSPGPRGAAAPFYGRFEAVLNGRVGVAVTLATVAVAVGPALVRRLRWSWVPALSGAVSVAWALALQRVDGSAVAAPLATRFEYLAGVADVDHPLDYLRTYTERLPAYPTHVRGHPPGGVLVAWALDVIGLDGPGPMLVLVLAAWAVAVAVTLMALRTAAGELAARRAAVPVALVPATVWVATSTDPLFAGVSAVGLAAIVLALHAPPGRRCDGVAAVGGLAFGVAMLLTYGAAPLVVVAVAVAVRRRRLRPLLVAGLAGTAVLGGVATAGFSWFDGLAATRVEYLAGVANERPYRYFVVGNLAAFAVACGPAVAAGLASMRRHQLDRWVLAAGALSAVLIADLSGLSKGEVERIWLPFVPWTVTVVATTEERIVPLRLLIAGQAACAIAAQALIRSPW